jgi:hypothetical protein
MAQAVNQEEDLPPSMTANRIVRWDAVADGLARAMPAKARLAMPRQAFVPLTVIAVRRAESWVRPLRTLLQRIPGLRSLG